MEKVSCNCLKTSLAYTLTWRWRYKRIERICRTRMPKILSFVYLSDPHLTWKIICYISLYVCNMWKININKNFVRLFCTCMYTRMYFKKRKHITPLDPKHPFFMHRVNESLIHTLYKITHVAIILFVIFLYYTHVLVCYMKYNKKERV